MCFYKKNTSTILSLEGQMIRLGGGAGRGGGGGKQRSRLVIARLLQSVNSMSNFGVIRYMYL